MLFLLPFFIQPIAKVLAQGKSAFALITTGIAAASCKADTANSPARRGCHKCFEKVKLTGSK
jgi:hypothetical protein